MIEVSLDSEGGFFSLSAFSISWGNSVDPFFDDLRMEGYCSFNFREKSIEFGAIDHDCPGIYLTEYKDGDIESTRTLFSLS
tara:strand:- start:861 stop:1103 length:243 start_codon:yes stop_codon:yes gene_type:complete